MARYSAFLGRAVEVHYRAGDICLPASGTFVADSGRSIFLEQHYEQFGQLKNFRWEIPYRCIVRLEEVEPPFEPASSAEAQSDPDCEAVPVEDGALRAAAGSSLIRLTQKTKTA